jgi:repressor LexA
MTLTKKQKLVLDLVRKYMKKNEIAPSLEEVRKEMDFVSVSTAHYHLKKLEQDGYIAREEKKARSIAIQPFDFVGMSISGNVMGIEYISIPLVGSANCGAAELLAEENIEGDVLVKSSLLPRKSGYFALRAVGKSLNRANVHGNSIEEGDTVLIDYEDRTPKNGDYVLSIINGAANLKKYQVKDGQVMLLSESTEAFKPIFIMSGDDWTMNGKIVAVIKKKKKSS